MGAQIRNAITTACQLGPVRWKAVLLCPSFSMSFILHNSRGGQTHCQIGCGSKRFRTIDLNEQCVLIA